MSPRTLRLGEPKTWAAGVPGVYALHGARLQADGRRPQPEDSWGDEPEGRLRLHELRVAGPGPPQDAEFCENGAKAVTWEATPLTVPTSFWAEHSVTDLLTKSDYWLGMQGRLIEPVYKPAGEDHYEPVSWDEAFADHRRQAQRPGLPGRGRVLHQRAHRERGRLRLPAVRARLRHQQPAGLLQHVPRVHRPGAWARPSASARPPCQLRRLRARRT